MFLLRAQMLGASATKPLSQAPQVIHGGLNQVDPHICLFVQAVRIAPFNVCRPNYADEEVKRQAKHRESVLDRCQVERQSSRREGTRTNRDDLPA